MFSNDKMLAEVSSQSDGGARQESDKSSVDSQGSLTNWLCHFNTQLGSYKNKLASDSCHLILAEIFLCQHQDIFSWISAMWADQLALSLGQLLLSERLSWQKCFASTSQSGGDIDEAQIGQKQLMAQSSDAFSCLVRFCTLDVFLDAFQTNLVTVDTLSHVLKSKEQGLMWKACHLRFHFVAASSEEWWIGVCSSQLRMPLKYLPIRPSIKCSLGRCKLKDQTIFLEEASTKRATWNKDAKY